MDRLPRLLVLSSTYPRWKDDPEPGFVHELARRLTRDFEVHVVCPHSRLAKAAEKLDNVTVHRYRYAWDGVETLVHGGGILANLRTQPLKWLLVAPFLFSQAWATYRAVKTLKPDVVHAHWIIPQGLIYAVVSRVMRSAPPMLLTSHGADLFGLQAALFIQLKKFVLRRASGLTVVSRSMANQVHQLGAGEVSASVVSMGVDFESLFTPGDPRQRSRNELLFVGRLVEKKGVSELLKSLPTVLSAHPDSILNIVGYGPMESSLRQWVKEKQLDDHVRFLGAKSQSELADHYRRAALLIAPFVRSDDGDQDGLGLVVIEAIACECPVLASDLPFVHDILDPTAYGRLLTPSGSPQALARSILNLLDNQDSLANEMRQLRSRLCEIYGWQAVTGQYRKILSELVTRDLNVHAQRI